jgi:PTS system mannose-specific IIC component/fructoselysine and glucoselysine-specific PTS system IIC component
MVSEAIILGIIGGVVYMESRLGGQHMLDRPIVIGLLVGLFLGDVKTGLIVGGSLELIWMGLMGIGTTTPPDVVVGATIAAGLAIKNDLPLETTLALAIPIAALAQMIFIAIVTLNSTFCHMADKYAEQGKTKGIEKTVFMGAALFFLSKFIFIAVGYAIGSEVIKALVDAIPPVVIQGLTVATGMIPALGVALLLQMTMTKKYIAFFILGFALVGFLNISTVAVTVFGLVAAIIYYQFSKNSQNNSEAL